MADGTAVTKTQRRLARHALGLGYGGTRSYRNRFAARVGTPDYAEWRALVDAGCALRYPWFFSYGDLFTLTRDGAERVITKRERLAPEDFPA